MTFRISSKVNHGSFEGLGGLSWEGVVGLVSDFASSTIGVVGGGDERDGSLDPVESWTINNLEISAKSASETEEREDSFGDSSKHSWSKEVFSDLDKLE